MIVEIRDMTYSIGIWFSRGISEGKSYNLKGKD